MFLVECTVTPPACSVLATAGLVYYSVDQQPILDSGTLLSHRLRGVDVAFPDGSTKALSMNPCHYRLCRVVRQGTDTLAQEKGYSSTLGCGLAFCTR